VKDKVFFPRMAQQKPYEKIYRLCYSYGTNKYERFVMKRLFAFCIIFTLSLSSVLLSQTDVVDLVNQAAQIKGRLKNTFQKYLEDATRYGANADPADQQKLESSKQQVEQVVSDYQRLVIALTQKLKDEIVENPAMFNKLSLQGKLEVMKLIRESEKEVEAMRHGRTITWGLTGLKSGATIGAVTTAVAAALTALTVGIVSSRLPKEYVAVGPAPGAQTAGFVMGAGLVVAPLVGFLTGTLGLLGGIVSSFVAPSPGASIQRTEPTKEAVAYVDGLLAKLKHSETDLQDRIKLQSLIAEQKALETKIAQQ
jgi:hypothetical protein